MAETPEADRNPGTRETLQVLGFLREFDQIRQPPVRHLRKYDFVLRQSDLPIGPGCECNLSAFGSEETGGLGGALGEASLLQVRKQVVTASPAPPRECQPWMTTDGADPEHPPVMVPIRIGVQPITSATPADRWDADPLRAVIYQTWLETTWTPWATAEAQRRRVQRLYERLFACYLQLKRDSEQTELIWGFGLLAWQVGDEDVWHPLMVGRVEMDFDRKQGVVSVRPTAKAPELASEILSGAGPELLDEFRRLEHQYHASPILPWDLSHARSLMHEVANCLGTGGTVSAETPTPFPTRTARIVPDGVLFVRRRRAGYVRDIEEWQDLITRGVVPPPEPVTKVVGAPERPVDPAGRPARDETPGGVPQAPAGSWAPIGEELLFPLPSNAEQREIARRIAQHQGVTVQGPPGCGKTHGVANLICHLLAHGKTILVTAQTDRALKVLRSKVPKAIRSLCVSVLGSDLDAQEELRESVTKIVTELGAGNGTHAIEADRSRTALREVRLRLGEAWGRMAASRSRERAEITLGSRTWTPSTIGAYLAEQAAEDGWVPDALPPTSPLPLSTAELQDLFGTLGSTTRDDLEEGMRLLPEPESLPGAEAFRTTLETRRILREAVEQQTGLETRWAPPTGADRPELIQVLTRLQQDVEQALEDLQAFEAPWLQQIRRQISSDRTRVAWWQGVLDDIAARRQAVFEGTRRLRARELTVTLPGAVDDQIQAVTALRDFLVGGRTIGRLFGLLHGSLQATRDACRVDGRLPSTVDDCATLLDTLGVARLRYELGRVLANELLPLGAPVPPGAALELEIEALVSPLQRLLRWREEIWEPLAGRCAALHCRVNPRAQGKGEMPPPGVVLIEERPGNEVATVTAILTVLDAALARTRLAHLEATWAALGEDLRAGAARPEASGVWRRLREAWELGTVDLWGKALEEAARLRGLRGGVERFAGLFARLRAVTPQWAAQILELAGDAHRAVVPERLPEAWLWRQLETWLTAHLSTESAEALRRQIDDLQRKERKLVEHQVVHATWAQQVARVSDAERRALISWQQTVAKIGKGFGKRTGELKREAQRLMSASRAAVPVWIMPLGRVAENFAPSGRRFDVVITDESSQMDAFGILALLRAERAIVIGDNMQISPAAVGVPVERVTELINAHLSGIPAKHLFDGQQSLYDLATRAFGGVIRLREHFRCMPEIIRFSNQFYGHEIRPLRDPASSTLLPSVVCHRVPGYRMPESKINEVEAAEISALIAACCAHPAYAHCSFGAISLLGEDQARAIYERVIRLVPEEELLKRDFVVGDAYHFQGDERDVMFLSMVEGPDGRAATMNRPADLQRFNVAASRAKDQLWIVHSVDAERFHAEDMRGRLLRFFLGQSQQEENWRTVEAVLADPETFYFQKRVAQALIGRGYAVRAEVRVGQYRIDLVVDGVSDSLAVECDGDKWHTLENLEEDTARQMDLERNGWRFVRVRGGEFFRNPARALESVWTRLEELGIHPVATTGDPAPTSEIAKEIIADAERRRAAPAAAEAIPADGVPASCTPESGWLDPGAPGTEDDGDPAGPTAPAEVIYRWLQDNPGWHGRGEILEGSGVGIDLWQSVIRRLLAARRIENTGSRRIAQYRAG